MLPTFFGLNTVTRALLAQQEAVDVVNQNISNVDTPGYSEQTAELQATDPYTVVAFNRPSLAGQMGTGSSVIQVNRAQDELLNAQIRAGNQSAGSLDVMNDLYTQIQAIYNDPSNVAINSAVSNLFDAVHSLSNTPEDDAARQLVAQDGASLTNAITTRYAELTTMQSGLNTKVTAIVSDINTTVKQIAALNNTIAQSQGIGDNANDLEDQRDQLVDHLSTLVDVRDVKNADGTDTIQMNGRYLVNKDQAYTLTALTDASSTAAVKPVQVFWQEDITKFENVNPGYDPITGLSLSSNAAATTPPLKVAQADVTTGSLAGTMTIRDQVIQNTLLPQLNEITDSFTNTQALSLTTGLSGSTLLSGSATVPDDFTVTVLTPQGTASPPGPGQNVTYSVGTAQAAAASITGMGDISGTGGLTTALTAGSSMTITDNGTSATYTASAGDTVTTMINFFKGKFGATFQGNLIGTSPQELQLEDTAHNIQISNVSGSVFSTLGFHQGTVQGVIDAINSSTVAPYVHASLNSSGQLQVDTSATGTLVKVDGANSAASKDFGFSASVADGFNMVHVQGYGLNTPPQWAGGISGLTLNSSINVGDTLDITGPDGATVAVTVPPPVSSAYPPPTTNTVGAFIDAINAKGLSHGFQAALDADGHLTIFSTPTVYGADGHLVGTPAQITGNNGISVTPTTSLFSSTGDDTLTITGPLGSVQYTAVSGDTVQTLMNKINAANIGVTASINSAGQFQLTTQSEGSGQSITLSGINASATDTIYSVLGLSAGTTKGLDHGYPPSSGVTVTANTTSLFGAASVAGAPFTNGGTGYTLSPSTGIGLTLSGNTYASGATITVTGTDATTGQTDTDVISVSADGTIATPHAYSKISSIALSGITGGTIAAAPLDGPDVFGDSTGVTLPAPTTSTNSNQFFFQGATQSLVNQVLAATSATGTLTPTTQPAGPSQLSFSIFNSPSSAATFTAATVTVTGVDAATGATVTETFNPSATGVFTTTHTFKSITSIAASGITNGEIQAWANVTTQQNDTAGLVSVDSGIANNPSLIAASSVPGVAGNDVNALALLNVQQQGVVTDGQTAATIGDFYSNITESLGGAAAQVNTNMLSEQQLVQHLTNQKQSIVGVNLDQEAATLVALQHAYEAAARAITTQDSMLDTIINGMGLVGR